MVIKIAKKEFIWTYFGVESIIAFNHILSHIDRGPMRVSGAFSYQKDLK